MIWIWFAAITISMRLFPRAKRPIEFHDALSRHDDGSRGKHPFLLYIQIRNRKAVPVGCHCPQSLLRKLQQQSVEVIPHVLLRHCKVGEIDELLQLSLSQTHARFRRRGLEDRKVLGGQRVEHKATASGAKQHPVAVESQAEIGI